MSPEEFRVADRQLEVWLKQLTQLKQLKPNSSSNNTLLGRPNIVDQVLGWRSDEAVRCHPGGIEGWVLLILHHSPGSPDAFHIFSSHLSGDGQQFSFVFAEGTLGHFSTLWLSAAFRSKIARQIQNWPMFQVFYGVPSRCNATSLFHQSETSPSTMMCSKTDWFQIFSKILDLSYIWDDCQWLYIYIYILFLIGLKLTTTNTSENHEWMTEPHLHWWQHGLDNLAPLCCVSRALKVWEVMIAAIMALYSFVIWCKVTSSHQVNHQSSIHGPFCKAVLDYILTRG